MLLANFVGFVQIGELVGILVLLIYLIVIFYVLVLMNRFVSAFERIADKYSRS